MTATKGLNFSEISFADRGTVEARLGKWVRSSSSVNPVLTREGSGTNDKTRTADSEVSSPLATRRVLRKAIQSCRVRGGNDRMATRRTIVTRHSNGSSNTRGASESFAHQGTTGGSWGSILAGCSAGTRV